MSQTIDSATHEQIKEKIYELLAQIAPKADLSQLAMDENVRMALDIDSFDLLNLLIGLHDAFGVEIPERDYGRLTTIQETAEYIAERAAGTKKVL